MRLVIALGILALTGVPAAGQQGSVAPDGLSLAEAIEIARENSPAYSIAAADLEIADARDRGLWASLLPKPLRFAGSLSSRGQLLRKVQRRRLADVY